MGSPPSLGKFSYLGPATPPCAQPSLPTACPQGHCPLALQVTGCGAEPWLPRAQGQTFGRGLKVSRVGLRLVQSLLGRGILEMSLALRAHFSGVR